MDYVESSGSGDYDYGPDYDQDYFYTDYADIADNDIEKINIADTLIEFEPLHSDIVEVLSEVPRQPLPQPDDNLLKDSQAMVMTGDQNTIPLHERFVAPTPGPQLLEVQPHPQRLQKQPTQQGHRPAPVPNPIPPLQVQKHLRPAPAPLLAARSIFPPPPAPFKLPSMLLPPPLDEPLEPPHLQIRPDSEVRNNPKAKNILHKIKHETIFEVEAVHQESDLDWLNLQKSTASVQSKLNVNIDSHDNGDFAKVDPIMFSQCPGGNIKTCVTSCVPLPQLFVYGLCVRECAERCPLLRSR